LNKANEIESRIIDALSLEELALCLIKKQYHVSRVNETMIVIEKEVRKNELS